MNLKHRLMPLQLLLAGLTASLVSQAPAAVYINEIYFNPPNAPSILDTTAEYIELRGTPGMSLANHYLIFVDTLDNSFHTGPAGNIETIFNLSTRSLGANGFLTIRQKGNGYTVAFGTTDLVNSGTGAGFGSDLSSSIGCSDLNSNGQIESGFTAMLIRNDSGPVPTISPVMDLDIGNNGLDVATGRAGWTILDSIGFTEPAEAFTARYYGRVNFGPEFPDLNPSSPTYFDPAAHMEPGATYAGTGFEIEYFARWGNSTGQTAPDWHVAGLTDNAGSGFQAGTSDFRQSTNDAHPAPNAINLPPSPMPATVTSTQGVPYGTILTNTLGAPNFLLGDYNKDGRVDAGDYVAWRNSIGQTGSDIADHPADGDHNYVVGPNDYAVWRAHFGQPPGSGSGTGTFADSSSSVPETSGTLLAVLAALGGCDCWLNRKRKPFR